MVCENLSLSSLRESVLEKRRSTEGESGASANLTDTPKVPNSRALL